MAEGEDPLAGKWVPVPLQKKEYSNASGAYAIEFVVPAQTLLLENFEAMAHDEVLRNAHKDGFIPIGQPIITSRPSGTKSTPSPAQAPLDEGIPMKPEGISMKEEAWRKKVRENNEATMRALFGNAAEGVIQDQFGGFTARSVRMVMVRVEILVGASLGFTEDDDVPEVGSELASKNVHPGQNTLADLLNQEMPDDLSELDL